MLHVLLVEHKLLTKMIKAYDNEYVSYKVKTTKNYLPILESYHLSM